MKQEEEKRRSFLQHILAGTVAVIGTAAVVRPAKAKSISPGGRTDETLYHESENFKRYYKSLRS
jgi:hypothetical protein